MGTAISGGSKALTRCLAIALSIFSVNCLESRVFGLFLLVAIEFVMS